MFRSPTASKLTTLALTALLTLATATAVGQTLAPGFGQTTLSGLAGGTVRAVRHGNTGDGMCQGWVASSPNHTFELTAATSLTIAVAAPSDTTLVVLGPDGPRCNDDSATSHNPQISGRFAAGEYRVYVGSYEEGQSIRYTLTLSD